MMRKLKLIIVLLQFFSIALVSAQNSDIRIIPQPNNLIEGNGNFKLENGLNVYASDITLYKLVDYTLNVLSDDFNVDAKLTSSASAQQNIQLLLEKSFEDKTEGAYKLKITNSAITISAANEQGLFYGVQSLRQLVSLNGKEATVSCLEISDAPRFGWRAFMLDEARYFKGKEQVFKLMDEMARLKMNVFHWHLVDDQGWRIEIKKYPLLTEIGSKRKSTQVGELKWKSPKQSGVPHEGFYTQEEIREIVKYASERHITIIPEIEMPGHSIAAIASYPWLGTIGKKIDMPTTFGVSKDVYNVADPKVYAFLTDVLDEVFELFPSKVIHIGGDEVKYDHWKNSAYIQNYMKENDLATPADLQIFFTNSISQYIESKERRMMGWNEIMGHNVHEYQDIKDTEVKETLAKSTVIHFWKGDVKMMKKAAEGGYSIVNSLHSNTYLDYPYTSISLEKAYRFNPIPSGLDKAHHKYVLGTGCQMWGEWIPTSGEMDYMVFPRIAAYAEVGWTKTEQKDFDSFQQALPQLLEIWKQKGIYYAPMEYANPKK